MATPWGGQGAVVHEASQKYVCAESGNIAYGDEKANDLQYMCSLTGTTLDDWPFARFRVARIFFFLSALLGCSNLAL